MGANGGLYERRRIGPLRARKAEAATSDGDDARAADAAMRTNGREGDEREVFVC